jgi:NAD(P)-dependent dehydrogenase (short-subunit alcohol dehydrogenase family)
MFNKIRQNNSRRQFIQLGGGALTSVAAIATAGNSIRANAQSSSPNAPNLSAQPTTAGSRFQDKVVLITGATSGIGRGTAIAFAREGARVVFCGRRTNLGQEVEQEIRQAGGEALYVRTDVMVPDQVKNLIDTTVATYGRLDIAFNNAGYEGIVVPFAEQTLDNWDVVMNTNARGVFLSMLYEIPQMLKQESGIIINNASTAGHIGFPIIPAYVASKHAIIGLTKSAALAHPRQGIRANSISPGFIDTPQVDRFVGGDQKRKAEIVQANVPVGRIGQVEEVAKLVMWLCTDDTPYINGADIVIDGGDLA